MEISKAHWVSEGNNLKISMPIAKVDREKRIVSGFATLDNVEQPNEQKVQTNEVNVEQLQIELQDAKSLIKNLRKYEKQYKEDNQKALEEQGKYKELYEAEQLRSTRLTETIKTIRTDFSQSTKVCNTKR